MMQPDQAIPPSPPAPPAALRMLSWASALLIGVGLYMALIYAPTERVMGDVQRVFYFHVGAAWAGALAFLVTAAAGAVYLITRRAAWDRLGHSAVEVGLVLMTMTLLSGPVWARSAWGTLWTWDPKLSSALAMWLAYAAYLMLRRGIEDPARRRAFGAIYSMVAFISVILTFVGVRFITAAIHPTVIGPAAGGQAGGFGMAPRMAHALAASVIAYTALFAALAWHRARLQQLAERVEALALHAMLASRGAVLAVLPLAAFAAATPDTRGFMALGYALILGAGALYVASLAVRMRRLRRREQRGA